MRLPWGIELRDFLYALLHTVVFLLVYAVSLEFTRGKGGEIGYGLIIAWFAALYLTVFYPVRWQAWTICFLSYLAFGGAIDYLDSYTLFHIDYLAPYGAYMSILIHAIVFAGPMMLSKAMVSLVTLQKA